MGIFETKVFSQRSDITLTKIGFDKRRADTKVAGGLQAGTMVAKVVDVRAVKDIVVVFGFCDFLKSGIERGFAVKTSVGWIGAVLGIAEFVRGDDSVIKLPTVSKVLRER